MSFWAKNWLLQIFTYVILLINKSTHSSVTLKKLNDYRNQLGVSLGEKITIEFPADVEDRAITFGRKKKIIWKKITNELHDSASNTGQYVKLVNSYLRVKKSEIEKIIELTNKFDEELQALKIDDIKIIKLNQIPLHEFNSEELKNLVQILLRDRKYRQENINKLKNKIIETEERLAESEKKIEILDDKILKKI